MIGLGTQDDFAYAQRFLSDTGVSSPTMLWDPSFDTWRRLGVTANSQMMLVSADLETRTDVWFGFDRQQQEQILGLLPELTGA